ncbi:hypothetical protein [Microbacterium pumilum]|uniref:Uncharacterized protein n=1 Tax=Microbacterium pumilum TaxID=344165 RepID=A0ABP5E5S5_9MICO
MSKRFTSVAIDEGGSVSMEVRMLEDATTLRFEVSANGHLAITRDVGFDGPDVWNGDARRGQPEVAASGATHQSVVSP